MNKTKKKHKRGLKTYAFIDASNIIYGTRDDGWKVDFKKLFQYLKQRYNCSKVYYFAGLEKKNKRQHKFYKKLGQFGYELVLKPVKIFPQPGGGMVRKANCDVDLTFYGMRNINNFRRAIFMSGDGDFEILLKHFLKKKKEVIVIANARRTAREIKQLKGIQFNDLGVLRHTIEK